MFVDVNHGPDDLKRRARQLPVQGYAGAQSKKGFAESGEDKKVLDAVGRGADQLGVRRPATAKALPVYLQQPTYLRSGGTAGRLQTAPATA
jgi:hypothetical protein